MTPPESESPPPVGACPNNPNGSEHVWCDKVHYDWTGLCHECHWCNALRPEPVVAVAPRCWCGKLLPDDGYGWEALCFGTDGKLEPHEFAPLAVAPQDCTFELPQRVCGEGVAAAIHTNALRGWHHSYVPPAVAPQSVDTYSGPVTVERIGQDSSGHWFHSTLSTGGGWSEHVSFEVEQAIAATAVDGLCPCDILEIPCSSQCSCVSAVSSGGCRFCTRYGSWGQRIERAGFIARAIREASAARALASPPPSSAS